MAMLSLVTLLAACGQTSAPATNGADAGLRALQTPSITSASPSPTTISLPYTFPKQWLPAPDGADLPASIGSFIFSPSSPQTGYVCGVTSDIPDNSAATPPTVSVTTDGGHMWNTPSGGGAHFKSACQLYIDQSDPRDLFAAAGDTQQQLTLYRSRDGGVTWTSISQPNLNMGTPSYINALAVVGSRLIVTVGISGEGNVTNPLFTSDDGGKTWQPDPLTLNGQPAQISIIFWVSGATLIVEAGSGCSGACGALRATNRQPTEKTRYSEPLSSQPPSPNIYLTSTDGVCTWSRMATPVSNFSNLSLAQSADGSKTYLVGTSQNVSGQLSTTTVAFYSSDTGATWRQLPTLVGVENGYPSPGSLGNLGIYVLPDGSVLGTAFHLEGTNYTGDAGAFLLRPNDAAPAWQPLILLEVSQLQAVSTPSGVRIWGIVQSQPGQSAGALCYFDIP